MPRLTIGLLGAIWATARARETADSAPPTRPAPDWCSPTATSAYTDGGDGDDAEGEFGKRRKAHADLGHAL